MAQTITIDLTPDGRRIFQRPYLYFSQGDAGQEFVINLNSRFGLEIPAGAVVKIEATKPSGFGFSETGVLSDMTATFTTAVTMTDEAGHFPVELSITASGEVLGTANFNFMVEPDPHPEGTTDGQAEEVIPELTQLVERAEDAASSVLDRQTVTNTLPAGSQATYNFDEETNTQTFGIPQGEAGAGAVDVTASAYSSSKTYAVGDYVIHNDYLYRCTTAITTAEAWTSGHWTQVLLSNDVSDVKSDIDDILIKSTNLFNPNTSTYGAWIDATNGQIIEDEATYAVSDYIDVNYDYIAVKGCIRVWSYNADRSYGTTVSTSIDGQVINTSNYKYVRIGFRSYSADRITVVHGNQIPETVEYPSDSIHANLLSPNISIYKNKKFSILGDSISTFAGFITPGNATYYPSGDVLSVSDTWWYKFSRALGLQLDTNNSWSGSRVTTTGGETSAGCGARAEALGTSPDVIIVWMGINDFNNEVAIGTYDGTTAIPTTTTTFREAYAIMLNKILAKYQSSEVWVCTLPQCERNAERGFPEVNGNGVALAEFNKAILELATAFGVKVLDHNKSGLTYQNMPTFNPDNLHPNKYGHSLIANNDIWQMDNTVRIRYPIA